MENYDVDDYQTDVLNFLEDKTIDVVEMKNFFRENLGNNFAIQRQEMQELIDVETDEGLKEFLTFSLKAFDSTYSLLTGLTDEEIISEINKSMSLVKENTEHKRNRPKLAYKKKIRFNEINDEPKEEKQEYTQQEPKEEEQEYIK